jgi:uncharacterized YccA/Bax inhibitor family protein
MAMMNESKNPVMRAQTFNDARVNATTGTMTMSGAINKSGILLVILVASAAFAWNAESMGLGMMGMILGLITCFVLVYNPARAPFLAPLYAVMEGLVVGTISVFTEIRYPGIAGNAAMMTFAVLGLMLGCYRAGILRATPMFTRIAVFATFAIMITYMVDMILGFFGHAVPMVHEGSPLGIGLSVVICGVAAMNLILDFDVFERSANARTAKYMEWYCGFTLLVTLVWLYLEMLRLLQKISKR